MGRFGDITFLIAEARDITERIEAERALRLSESRLSRAEVVARFGNWEFRLDSNEVYGSEGARIICGVEADRFSILEVQKIALAQYRSMLSDALTALIYEGRPFNVEFKIRRPTDRKEVHIHAIAEYSRKSNVVFGVLQDITERRETEEELKRIKFAVDSSTDAIGMATSRGRHFYQNEAYGRLFGFSVEEMCGLTPCTAIFKDSERGREVFDTIMSGKSWHGELEMMDKAGRCFPVCLRADAVKDTEGKIISIICVHTDISERKRAEEKLLKSEEKYRELVESANSIILRMDNSCRVTFINEFAQSFFGYSEEEMLGAHAVGTIVPPVESTGRDLRAMMADLVLDPDRYAYNINENMRRGGERAWIAWGNKPIRYEKGRVVEILCVGQDITERKLAEEALKRVNLLLSTQKETSIEGFHVVDENGAITSSNRRFSDMWGISPELMRGGDHTPVLRAAMEKVKEPELSLKRLEYLYGDRNATSLEEIALKDGRTFERYTAPMNGDDGKYYGRVWYFRDITERKAMERVLAETEAKYRDIFENSVTGICQVGMDGRVLRANAAVARMLGYDCVEEALGAVNDLRRSFVHEQVRSELVGEIEKHGVVKDFEAEVYRKDGSTIWASLNVRAVCDETSAIAYLEGSASDITERKLLKAQLHHAQKMEAIGTLAGGIAHDFNNILTPIIGYSELSLKMAPEDGRLGHNIRQVLLAANRAKELVRQILSFSRKAEQEKKPVRIGLIIKEVLQLLRASLPSVIEIDQQIHPDAVDSTTLADPSQIHQVLMNLCTNAAHAMAERGGTLRVGLEKVEIAGTNGVEKPDLQPGTYLKLSVSDTGHGMEPSVQSKVFDPYFTTKGSNEGTGMGLSVVYGIVQTLGGAISVASRQGKGATFDVFFQGVQVGPQTLEPRAEPLPGGRGKVLVVDDEKQIVDMMKEMLEVMGYEAIPSYSSPEALNVFNAKPDHFDMVITDLTMPQMTGIDLAMEILKIRADTPVILCTGFSHTVDQKSMKQSGIRDFLLKPVSIRELAVTVNKHCLSG